MDKRELKSEIVKKMEYTNDIANQFSLIGNDNHSTYYHGEIQGLSSALKHIDQLDEPETLSQEWIDDHLVYYGFHYIDPDDLKQLIVRKSEKVIVPAFVGERIKEYKELKYGVSLAFNIDGSIDSDVRFSKWLSKKESNGDLFARAWLDGFTVEKEQKYILSINITDKASKTNYETFLNKRGIFHSMENESFNSEEFNWSEEEIKDLESGEILFEHFATKVGELEE